MKRVRREERRAGINDRIRARAVESESMFPMPDMELFGGVDGATPRGIVAGNGPRDHLGDCAGFGAPQARAFRERSGWRS
jgi:hypothetical protein